MWALRNTLVLTVLVLPLAAPVAARAQAPSVAAAPIAFRNSTNMTLTVQAESIVDGFGMERVMTHWWTVKPGEYSYLVDPRNNRIQATRFNYKIKTPGKISRWFCVSNHSLVTGPATRSGAPCPW